MIRSTDADIPSRYNKGSPRTAHITIRDGAMRNHFLAVSLFLAFVGSTLSLIWPDPALASNYKGAINQQKLGIAEDFGRFEDGEVNWVYNPTDAPAPFDDDAYFLGLLEEAMAELEGVSGLTFVYQGIDENAEIDNFDDLVVAVGWEPLGGAAGVAGPAFGAFRMDLGYFPYTDGRVKFNKDTDWVKDTTDFTERGLKSVAVHELIHLVGLGHSDIGISVMFADPYNFLNHPREDDIDGLQSLYGEPDQLWQESVYMPPGAVASPFRDSYISTDLALDTEITEIDENEPATNLWWRWEVDGEFIDDVTMIVTDPHGFHYQGNVVSIDCAAGFVCTGYGFFGSVATLVTFPGDWTVYLIYNGQHVATESLMVNTNPVYNQAPDSTFTQDVNYGPAPLTVDMNLSVTGDNEGDLANATWHIPTVGIIERDSGYFGGNSVGTDTQTVTFNTPGEYEIYVEVNDDWTRYSGTPGGDTAGDGYRTLYRRVVNVTKVSDDVTTFMDVTGDSIPDLAAFVGRPSVQPKIRVYSGADRSVYTLVKYLTNKWRGIAIATVRDANQNGNANDPAVALLADHDTSNKIIVQTRRLDTGAKVGQTEFANPNWRAIDVIVIDDTNSNGNTNDTSIAVLLQHRTNGKVLLQIRKLSTGSLVKNINFLNSKWIAISAAIIIRGGRTPFIGVLGEHRTNGKRLLQSRVLSTGAVKRSINFFNAGWTVKDVTAIHDPNGDGATNDRSWQVLAVRKSDKSVFVQTRQANNGSIVSKVKILNPIWEGLRLDSALDMNGNNSNELAVSVKKRSTGRRLIHVKDYQTGKKILNIYP